MTNNPANWTNVARHASAAPRFHTIREVAERLNVCERTVRRWIDFEVAPCAPTRPAGQNLGRGSRCFFGDTSRRLNRLPPMSSRVLKCHHFLEYREYSS